MLQKSTQIFIATFVTFIFFITQNAFAQDKTQPTISITGTGNVSVAPDMAILSFGVVEEASTAREALDANNKAMSSILSAMKENGIEAKDLQTSGLIFSPVMFIQNANQMGSNLRLRLQVIRFPIPLLLEFATLNKLDRFWIYPLPLV